MSWEGRNVPTPRGLFCSGCGALRHRHLRGCAAGEVGAARPRDLQRHARICMRKGGSRGSGAAGAEDRRAPPPRPHCSPPPTPPALPSRPPSPRLLGCGSLSPNRGSSARGCAPISMTKRVFTWPRPRRARLCPGSDDRAAALPRAPPSPPAAPWTFLGENVPDPRG